MIHLVKYGDSSENTERDCRCQQYKSKISCEGLQSIISELGVKPPTCDPMKCVVKVANKATIDERTKRQAIKMMDDVTKKAGKDPMGLAATVLQCHCQQD